MTARKGMVLDANILIRAVFGEKVRQLLESFEDVMNFYAPDVCFAEARKYIPVVAQRRKFDEGAALSVLDGIERIVQPVDLALYQEYEKIARQRVHPRDAADWPVAALALLLNCPIWTEDRDFFGSGIAVWTTDRVELYMMRSPEQLGEP